MPVRNRLELERVPTVVFKDLLRGAKLQALRAVIVAITENSRPRDHGLGLDKSLVGLYGLAFQMNGIVAQYGTFPLCRIVFIARRLKQYGFIVIVRQPFFSLSNREYVFVKVNGLQLG